MRNSLVREVMGQRVIAVTEDTQFKVIVAAMRYHRVSAVPVLDAGGRVLGVVSSADLVLNDPSVTGHLAGAAPWHRTEHRKAMAETAGVLMTSPAITITGQRPVAEAAELMRRHRINHLPVVGESTGQMIGIVTRFDLLGVYLWPDSEIHDEIRVELAELFPAVDPADLRVNVLNGVVELHGQVRNRSTIKKIVSVVADIEGVVHVEDHLDRTHDGPFPLPRSSKSSKSSK